MLVAVMLGSGKEPLSDSHVGMVTPPLGSADWTNGNFMETAHAPSGSQGHCSRCPDVDHQDTLAPEAPRMSPQGTRLDLKSEHHLNSPTVGSAAYLCTLHVLISESCATYTLLHSSLLPETG
jgi:hypothetical protein